MAQDSVVKELLTERMIQAGAELTRQLDARSWPVRASLWVFISEGNQWKLLLASPRVKIDGPKKSYEIVQSALAETPVAGGTIMLSDIAVTDPEDPLLGLLRVAITTGPTLSGIRFAGNVINGHFIDDAYIYRISDMAPTGEAS